MKKRSYKLPLIFLIIGVMIGGAIRVLENYIAEQLIALLREEVEKSCNCVFKHDGVTVSLLTQRGRARNARIVADNEVKLLVPDLRGFFSLSDISKRQLILSRLELHRAQAKGVSPDSATYKFIDHLSAPIPPERDRPGKWKLRLEKLTLHDGTFSETLSGSELRGKDASLVMERDKNNDFVLHPVIGALSLHFNPRADSTQETRIRLGQITGTLTIDDEHINYDWARMTLGNSWFKGTGKSFSKKGNTLLGDLIWEADTESLGVGANVQAKATGRGNLEGTLRFPKGAGDLKNALDAPVNLPLAAGLQLRFDEMAGKYEFAFLKKSPELKIPELTAHSVAGNKALLLEPIYVSDDTVSGVLKLIVDSLESDRAKARGALLTVDFNGSPFEPSIRVTGPLASFTFLEREFSALWLNVDIKPGGLSGTVHAEDGVLGPFDIRGALDLTQSPPQILDKLNLTFTQRSEDTPIASVAGAKNSPFDFAGTGHLTGALAPELLKGEIALSALSPLMPEAGNLDISAKIADGSLSVLAHDGANSIDAQFSANFSQGGTGKLRLTLTDLKLEQFNRTLACSTLSAETNYAFSMAQPLLGSGSVELHNASLACPPNQAQLDRAYSLDISAGTLQMPSIVLNSALGSLSLSGKSSFREGHDLRASGSISLAALLPWVSAVDELDGTAELKAQIKGTLFDPQLDGSLILDDGRFSVESLNVGADGVTGSLQLGTGALEVTGLSGDLNGGTFSISGKASTSNISLSNISTEFSGIFLQLNNETDLTCSGTLTLKELDTGKTGIAGTVIIDSGEFRRQIDFASLLRALTTFLFSREEVRAASTKLPMLDLDINISAPRNLFAITNLFGVELTTDLKITGNLNSPQISGEMSTLSGWLGFKERAFEITSGRIIFKPELSDPLLEFVGESYFRSREGDNTLVFLSASGSLRNPRITLSSERGLSQKEILDLITTGFAAPRSTALSRFAGQMELSEQAMLGRDSLSASGVKALVRELTTIGSLSLEPSYNPLRGVNEPAIVARKNLTDRISLVGESFLGSTTGGARVRLLYDLTPAFNIAGVLDTLTTRERSALGLDATYTVLARYSPFLTTEIKGASAISEQTLREHAKLHSHTRLPVESLKSVEDQILGLYRANGYFAATLQGDCLSENGLCRKLSLVIHEGPLSVVSAMEIEGDALPGPLMEKGLGTLRRNAEASLEVLDNTVATLIHELRSEGYIGARISARYESAEESDHKVLVLSLRLGRPVTFVFRGNQRFTPAQFLDTISLFDRRQPFGNNTINILVQNIERKYREDGYLYVTIQRSEETDAETGRITYIIDIEEGPQTPLSGVILMNMAEVSEARLRAIVAAEYSSTEEMIFEPRFALAEEIENNMELLRSIWVREGFPEIKVSYALIPDEERGSVAIHYNIDEGRQLTAASIEVLQAPKDVKLPELPELPISIPKINRFVETLSENLSERGYVDHLLAVNFDTHGTAAVVQVEAGFQSRISRIDVDGNVNVASATILENLSVRAGNVWDSAALIDARNRLLALGLFSRVELAPTDGSVDSNEEALLVKLEERPMQFLEVGSGVNSEYGFHLFGEATDRGIFRDGKAFSIRLDSFYDSANAEVSQGVASITYSDPQIVSSRYSFTEDVRYQKLDLSTQEFNLDRVSLNSYIYRGADGAISHSFGHTILHENLDDVSAGAVIGEFDTGSVTLSYLAATLSYDKRDSPLNPSRGFNTGLESKLALSEIASDADYFSLGARFSFLWPLAGKNSGVILASHTRLAASWTLGDTGEIPISQRYYLGGRNSIRGFRENSLGPRGDDGSIIGGDTLLANNFELRYQTSDITSVHLFFDAGNVYLQSQDGMFDDLRTSAGIGLRYLSPIGPVGFDIGHPLDERSGEPSLRFHFALGSSF